MNCKYCGQMIEDDVSFCPHCGKNAKEEPAKEQGYSYETAPATAPVQASTVSGAEQKSRVVAGLMGILFGLFLGGLGIHNFYLGYTGKAWGQLLITVLSFGTLSFISSIWGLIEGILYLTGRDATDANGVPLRD